MTCVEHDQTEVLESEPQRLLRLLPVRQLSVVARNHETLRRLMFLPRHRD